jgi:hypothetical protein
VSPPRAVRVIGLQQVDHLHDHRQVTDDRQRQTVRLVVDAAQHHHQWDHHHDEPLVTRIGQSRQLQDRTCDTHHGEHTADNPPTIILVHFSSNHERHKVPHISYFVNPPPYSLTPLSILDRVHIDVITNRSEVDDIGIEKQILH